MSWNGVDLKVSDLLDLGFFFLHDFVDNVDAPVKVIETKDSSTEMKKVIANRKSSHEILI